MKNYPSSFRKFFIIPVNSRTYEILDRVSFFVARYNVSWSMLRRGRNCCPVERNASSFGQVMQHAKSHARMFLYLLLHYSLHIFFTFALFLSLSIYLTHSLPEQNFNFIKDTGKQNYS